MSFVLDDFQVRACEALESGRGVLVAAPTGAGKTVVGEFAVHLALAAGRKAFYTTPIKALSNQKYGELVARHGAANVGLLTGDTSVNGEAPVVVMTTEVLRNMLYADSPTLRGLAYVVMDEVHYLADRFRGAVWEEVIIHLADDVRVVSLSATVSNAEEFGAWLDMVRGDTEVVVEEHRPVPLYQHVIVGSRLLDLFVDAGGDQVRVNPELLDLARDEQRRDRFERPRSGQGRPRGRGGPTPPRRGGPPRGTPSRAEVVQRLDAAGLLPAITFVFSRAGCDGAVRQCLLAGIALTTPEQALQIRAFVQERTAGIPAEDLDVLGYWEWLDGLTRGDGRRVVVRLEGLGIDLAGKHLGVSRNKQNVVKGQTFFYLFNVHKNLPGEPIPFLYEKARTFLRARPYRNLCYKTLKSRRLKKAFIKI